MAEDLTQKEIMHPSKEPKGEPIPPFNHQEFNRSPELFKAVVDHLEKTGQLKMEESNQEIMEHKVNVLLREEKEGRQNPRDTEKILDEPEYKEKHPEFRAALLKRLKELGRVSEDKE